MTTKIKAIALGLGYAEESLNSWLIYQPGKYFNSKKEALESLTLYLYNKFVIDCEDLEDDKDLKSCCKQTLELEFDNKKYCLQCGHNISNYKNEFDPVVFSNFIYDLGKTTAVKYGEHFYIENPDQWSPWEFIFEYTKKNMLVIPERAEVQITKILARIKPELFQNPDNIFYIENENWDDTDLETLIEEKIERE